MKEVKWEDISVVSYVITQRLKVPGGWLVHRRDWNQDDGECAAMCFISDPEHKWKI